MAAQHPHGFKDQRRFDVEHAIPETLLRPRMTIVHLVGVQHRDLTGRADLGGATVVERLDAAVVRQMP